MIKLPPDDQLIEGQCWHCGKVMKDTEQATPYECVTCEATLPSDTPMAGTPGIKVEKRHANAQA